MYGICWVPSVFFFFSKNRLSKILFQILSQKNRSDCESEKSGFGFDPTNPPGVWILWIHDPFLDTGIRIWIFPKKRTRSHGNFKIRKLGCLLSLSARAIEVYCRTIDF